MVITLAIILALLILDVILILFFQNRFALTEDGRNVFAEKSTGEMLTWLITFATTGYNEDTFPSSTAGKFAAALMPLASVGGVLFLFFYGTVKRNRRVDREARGYCVPPLKGHVLICGWNERMPEVVRQITLPHRPLAPKKVVILADLPGEKPLEAYGFRPEFVFSRKGISSDYRALEQARIAFRSVRSCSSRRTSAASNRLGQPSLYP